MFSLSALGRRDGFYTSYFDSNCETATGYTKYIVTAVKKREQSLSKII